MPLNFKAESTFSVFFVQVTYAGSNVLYVFYFKIVIIGHFFVEISFY